MATLRPVNPQVRTCSGAPANFRLYAKCRHHTCGWAGAESRKPSLKVFLVPKAKITIN